MSTRAVLGHTPIKAWTKVKPSIKYLKVFNCICYYYVSWDRRNKLDDNGTMGTFLGYVTYSKGYKIYCLSDNNIVISMDGIFDEDCYWDWDLQQVCKCAPESETPSAEVMLHHLILRA